MTDFDEELRVSLHKHAGAVPPRPNLADAAIRQAHGIRRRRRIGAAVAAAAVVAIAVPVGLQAGDSLTRGDREPAPVEQEERTEEPEITRARLTVDLAELGAGDPPAVPYVDGARLIVDGSAVGGLGVAAPEIDAITYVGDTAFFSVRTDEGGRVLRSAPDVGVDRPIAAGPWSSSDDRYVAVLEQDGRLTVTDVAKGGEHSADLPSGHQLTAVKFADSGAYLLATDPTAGTHTLLRWSLDGDGEPTAVDGIERATAVSPGGELVADMYRVDDLTASSCTRLTSLTTDAVLWETCRHRIEGFSPDGRYVWGANEYASGPGDTYNVVLDAFTGEEVLRVDGPESMDRPLSFVDSTFESATTLLISAEQGGQAALVRCDLTSGECVRATDLAEVEFPYEGNLPYELLG